MTVVETVLIFVGIPLAVLLGLSLLAALPTSGGRPRYRNGQPWEYAPVWWSANPAGLESSAAESDAAASDVVVGGGARGTW